METVVIVNPSIDHNTHAADPGLIVLSETKLRRLEPETFGHPAQPDGTRRPTAERQNWLEYLTGHLAGGDSRAAMVMSVYPLHVAVYSDELDWAVVLGYPQWLVPEYQLVPGQHLLSVNTYATGEQPPADVRLGHAHLGRWVNVFPQVAEFLTDDLSRPAARLAEIDEREWRLLARYGYEYLTLTGGRVRDGRPTKAFEPAAP